MLGSPPGNRPQVTCTTCGEPYTPASDGALHDCVQEINRSNEWDSDAVIGQVLGNRYKIISHLSSGGMGSVYRARHIVLGSELAIKILHQYDDEEAAQRFVQEAKLASMVRHPHTIYISDFGALDDGRMYLVMELLTGEPLGKAIESGKLPILRACRIALQVAQGLGAVHDKGIVHRDLKPDNVFLFADEGDGKDGKDAKDAKVEKDAKPEKGGTDGKDPKSQSGSVEIKRDFVKIVDFGIAKGAGMSAAVAKPSSAKAEQKIQADALKKRLTAVGMVVGTPHYMSPEQAQGQEADARADQYSLGCILYEMLTGVAPFDHPTDPSEILMMQVVRAPPPLRAKLKDAPGALERLILRMMEKEADDRFPSMREVENELSQIILQLESPGFLPARQSLLLRRVLLGGRLIPVWGLVLPGLLVTLAGLATVGLILYRRYQAENGPLQASEVLSARQQALLILRQAVKGPERDLRVRALEALGQSRDGSQRSVIEPLLVDGEPELQSKAAESLGLLGERAAVPTLLAVAEKAPATPPGLAAASAAAQLGAARGKELLSQRLKDDKKTEGRLRAAYLLSALGDDLGLSELRKLRDRGGLPGELELAVQGRLAQFGDETARTALLRRLNGGGRKEELLIVATSLSRAGDEAGRRYVRTAAAAPGPEQVLASRLLCAVSELDGAPLLRQLLRDDQAAPAARLLAIEGLGDVGQRDDLRPLLRLLKGEPGRMRTAAAAAVLQITGRDPGLLSEQSLRWASAALDDGDWATRSAAIAVLGDVGGVQAGALLGRALRSDRDAKVRRNAARALGQRSDNTSAAALASGLSDSDAGVRNESLLSVVKLTSRLGEKALALASELRPALTKLSESGLSTESVLATAALSRGGDKAQEERLKGLATTAAPALRKLAVENGGLDSGTVVKALTDEDVGVRLAAAKLLAARGDSRAAPILRTLATSGGALATEAYRALRALGESVNPPADLRAQLEAGEEAAAAALSTIDKLPLDEAQRLLGAAARNRDPQIRMLAATAAAELKNEAQGLGQRILRSLLTDPDAAVRTRAAAVLAKLEGAAPSAAAEKAVEPPAAPPAKPEAATGKEPTPTEPPPTPAANETKAVAAGALIEELLRDGREALAKKDYRKAQKLLEKANNLCLRKREYQKVCTNNASELATILAQVYESQERWSEAATEYERAISAPPARGKGGERAAAQESLRRLEKRLGRVAVSKLEKGRCQTAILWLPPGSQRIQLGGGQYKWVEVKGGERVEVRGCQ